MEPTAGCKLNSRRGRALSRRRDLPGQYSDASFIDHGFLRTPSGVFISFDPSPSPASINPAGAITGYYSFGANLRGFLRTPDGTFIGFDAATYPPCCISTLPTSINAEGAITGYYIDGYRVFHGFLRRHDGSIIALDAPGAGTQAFQGTTATSINPSDVITGYYVDANNISHGFVWRSR